MLIGDAGVTVNATITNGTKVATDFLSQLSSLVLNGECNGTASKLTMGIYPFQEYYSRGCPVLTLRN